MFASFHKQFSFRLLLLVLGCVFALAACGGPAPQAQKKPTPTPTPTVAPVANSSQAQALLKKVGKALSDARTLHGIFNLQIEGQLLHGNLNSEIWNASPDKNRTLVLSSTISQFPARSVTVTNGKQAWQYDPAKKVVYTGAISTSRTGSSSQDAAGVGGQSQLVLGIIQTVFTRSNATIAADNVPLNGVVTTDVHVVSPQANNTAGATRGVNLQYTGDVYIDKAGQKPVRIDLGISGLGQVRLDLPRLDINPPLAADLFTFVPPPGTKVLPLQQANQANSSGRIPFIQAQQQAGYHLLSIPGSQTSYELNGVNVLGAPGNQIYTLNYDQGNQVFTIAEGRSLANLSGTGSTVELRGTTATFSSAAGTNTLAWTEKGVGIRINGKLSKEQLVAIANLLS